MPYNVPANQFLNLEGQKISTSRNWAVWVHEFVEDLPGMEDVLRYYLTRIMPEQRDSEFTWKGFQEANNNELVNNLANFVNRVIVLVNKYFDGLVPEFDEDKDFMSPSDVEMPAFHDSEMLDLFDKMHSISDGIRKYEFRNALSELMDLSAKGNQLLQYNEPWKAIKEDEELVKVVINAAIQYVAALSVIVRPFMPTASDKIRTLLNLTPIKEEGELEDYLNKLAEGELLIESGHKIGAADHLFTRVSDEIIDTQIAKLKTTTEDENGTIEPFKDSVAFDDFVKMDLRTATIIAAHKVPKASKLLEIKINLGTEERTVVSGIAEHYKADEIIGKKVVLLANLAPRKIRGVESQGMILMAEGEDGKLGFVSPEDGWGDGMTIR